VFRRTRIACGANAQKLSVAGRRSNVFAGVKPLL
jgi:hypothetical protein